MKEEKRELRSQVLVEVPSDYAYEPRGGVAKLRPAGQIQHTKCFCKESYQQSHSSVYVSFTSTGGFHTMIAKLNSDKDLWPYKSWNTHDLFFFFFFSPEKVCQVLIWSTWKDSFRTQFRVLKHWANPRANRDPLPLFVSMCLVLKAKSTSATQIL